MWFVKSKRAQTSDDDETWVAGGVAPTLNAFDMGDTRATTLVFPIQGTVIGRSDEAGPQGKGYGEDGEVMFTLDRVSGHAIAFSHNQGLDSQASEEASPTLRSGGNGMSVSTSSVVRRLTPTECERLQGFPDGWTDGQADSHRYKQMGNAVAVPVVQWIIDRLVK